jgi:hypothetical protein
MRPDHNQFKIIANKTIRKKILDGFYFELMDKHPTEVPFFLCTDGWVFGNLAYLFIVNSRLLSPENPS